MSTLVTLAPEVPELSALGARDITDFLDGGQGLATAARVQPLAGGAVGALLRVPLPGTPDASGRRVESPRGAGTGWLRVRVFESGPFELVRSRLAAPASSSPAARRWNLLCHLRSQGVGAPRPLALLESPRGFGQLSVCVEAELEGFQPLPGWLAARAGAARARGLRALGLALGALERSGVRLARARAEGLLVADPEAGDDDCVALGIARLRDERAHWSARGLVRARLPALAFEDLEGAHLDAAPDARAQLTFLTELWRDLERHPDLQLSRRESLAVYLRARVEPLEPALLAQSCSERATAWESVES